MAVSRPSPSKPKAPPKAGVAKRPAAKRASADSTRPAPVPAAARSSAATARAAAPPPQGAAGAGGVEKEKKIKLVRDSFTMPKPEYAAIDVLKARAARLGRPSRKSEMLRAGVMALSAMPDGQLLGLLAGLPAIKTGRPAKPKSPEKTSA